MDRSEAGCLGGNKTSLEYGINRYECPQFGGLCPRKIEEKSEFYARIGSAGGKIGAAVTRRKYGKDYRKHMSEIGRQGGRGNTRRKKLGQGV